VNFEGFCWQNTKSTVVTPRISDLALSVHACKTDRDRGVGEMKTGQDVIEPGLYASECCGEEVALDKDASFPRCHKCKGLSEWELVDLPEQSAA